MDVSIVFHGIWRSTVSDRLGYSEREVTGDSYCDR